MSLLQNTQALLDLQEQIRGLPSNEPIIVQPILENVTITPSETEQHVTAGPDADGIDTATVRAIPSNYVGSDIPRQAASNVAPTESEQVAVASGKYTTGDVKVGAIPTNHVGSAVPRQAGKTVTPSDIEQTAIASGTYATGDVKVAAIPAKTLTILSQPKSFTTHEGAVIHLSVVADGDGLTYQWQRASGTSTNWANSTEPGNNTATLEATLSTSTLKYQCIVSDSHGATVTSDPVVITAYPSRSSQDLAVNGASVGVPVGFYAAPSSKTIASGTEGTPSASKGAVSNNQVTITPTVTNKAGYIAGGTKTGSPVTVKASDLVSGSQTKTENGTYDVTNLAQLIVNVSQEKPVTGTATASTTYLTIPELSNYANFMLFSYKSSSSNYPNNIVALQRINGTITGMAQNSSYKPAGITESNITISGDRISSSTYKFRSEYTFYYVMWN